MPGEPRCAAVLSGFVAACTKAIRPRQPGRDMRVSTNRHATQGTRLIIALVSFFPPSHVALLRRRLSFTMAAVVTYNTILIGLLSALMAAAQLNAIMVFTH